jgi:hypothetical protein
MQSRDVMSDSKIHLELSREEALVFSSGYRDSTGPKTRISRTKLSSACSGISKDG